MCNLKKIDISSDRLEKNSLAWQGMKMIGRLVN
jgi:hypothetical protein